VKRKRLFRSKKDEQSAILAQAQNDKAVAEQMQADLQASSDAIRAMLQQRAAERVAAAAAAAAAAQSGWRRVAVVITLMYKVQANLPGRYPVLLRPTSAGVTILFSDDKYFTPVSISALMKAPRYMLPMVVLSYSPVGWTAMVMLLLSTMVTVFPLYTAITLIWPYRKVNL